MCIRATKPLGVLAALSAVIQSKFAAVKACLATSAAEAAAADARHAKHRAELAAAAAAAESVYPAVDQAAAADDLARQLAQIQNVHDARAAYAARRRSEAAVAADARIQEARMHLIEMNRRRAAAVAAAGVVAAGAEAEAVGADARAEDAGAEDSAMEAQNEEAARETNRVASHNRALAVIAERVAAGLVGWGGVSRVP